MKKIKNILIGTTLTALAASAAAGYYFYQTAFVRKAPTQTDCDPASLFLDSLREPRQWLASVPATTLSMMAPSGIHLKARYIAAETPTAKTVILVHGYTTESSSMANFAQYYHDTLGYNVLLPDNRAHGESEGSLIGFGWLDRLDLRIWIHRVILLTPKEFGKPKIVLHGVSMGGATVLMASGDPQPEAVKAIVSDCAYTSVWDEMKVRLKADYKLPPFPTMYAAMLFAKYYMGTGFTKASALLQTARSKTPTLFIHGDADDYVPFSMVAELYEACSASKALYIAKGAKHAEAWATDERTYQENLVDFLNIYVGK